MQPAMGQTRTDSYLPVADYGLIGDGHTAALVSSDGAIDWWCPRRFDAPSVFARILDLRKGGSFTLTVRGRHTREMAYVPDTNVLRQSSHTSNGAVDHYNFMPAGPAFEPPGRLVRLLRCTRGEVGVDFEFAPRFAYGRLTPEFERVEGGAIARAGDQALALSTDLPLEVQEARIVGRADLTEGETHVLAVTPLDPDAAFPRTGTEEAERVLSQTCTFWQDWAAGVTYEGPYRDAVVRSALVLRLLQHTPTGSVIAAPTSSIPEQIGGVRNWDYRYSWIRDAAFAVAALSEVGHRREGIRFMEWTARVLAEEKRGLLHIMYKVDGSTDLEERELPHLEGYRGSSPVRVGNGAVNQRQLDVYGEMVDSLHLCRMLGEQQLEGAWPLVRELVDHVCANWQAPDSGIWEVRANPRHFVHSKVMAWVALDRGVRAIEDCGFEGPLERWRATREAIREDVLRNGYDERIGAFVQAYGSPALDAANLLIPLVGFLPADDPRVVSTVERIQQDLTSNGLVYRYLDADDGLPGGEATFTICAFWLTEALAQMGRVEEATRILEGVLDRASPLGLLAEQLDPVTGEHLGNYPQGFSHLGLLNAAVALERARRGERNPSPRLRINAPSPPS